MTELVLHAHLNSAIYQRGVDNLAMQQQQDIHFQKQTQRELILLKRTKRE